MIPELRKVAQLNIKYRKKWGSIIQVDVCIRAPPDEVTAWHAHRRSFVYKLFCFV